jgi:misacylated tRNA(Ala) deacylase
MAGRRALEGEGMTDLLCNSDSYLKEFDARVMEVNVSERAVALDRTAFFPRGGGRSCDRGWLADPSVTRAARQGNSVWHWLEAEPPAAGSQVHGKLDWEQRYKLMRTHTAFHILCGVVWRDWKAQVTGGNMEPLKGHMDFEFETLQYELVAEIEKRINAEVAAARTVSARILHREEAFQIPDLIRTKISLLPKGIRETRIVEIMGLDLQADGGTHVANMREVGAIRVVGYESKGKINKRIRLEIE